MERLHLKQIGSGTASDFNVRGALSQAEIAAGLSQHNRPIAALRDGQKSANLTERGLVVS
jgi:hypothetical protein